MFIIFIVSYSYLTLVIELFQGQCGVVAGAGIGYLSSFVTLGKFV